MQTTEQFPADRLKVVRTAAFSQIADGEQPADQDNLEMVMDLDLQVRVELGRAEMSLKDLVRLRPGSVFELDREIGEPVTVYIRDRMVARGEVVVVDERFGIRITEVVRDRIEQASAR